MTYTNSAIAPQIVEIEQIDEQAFVSPIFCMEEEEEADTANLGQELAMMKTKNREIKDVIDSSR